MRAETIAPSAWQTQGTVVATKSKPAQKLQPEIFQQNKVSTKPKWVGKPRNRQPWQFMYYI